MPTLSRHRSTVVPFVVVRAWFILCFAILASAPALAQRAPRPLPPAIDAHIGLPYGDIGPREEMIVRVELGALPWTIEGCVASHGGACTRTRSVELDEATRAELVRFLEDAATPRRCEPEGFAPGDPEYRLVLPSVTYSGHVPRDHREIGDRSFGPCRAALRLALFIVRTFGREP